MFHTANGTGAQDELNTWLPGAQSPTPQRKWPTTTTKERNKLVFYCSAVTFQNTFDAVVESRVLQGNVEFPQKGIGMAVGEFGDLGHVSATNFFGGATQPRAAWVPLARAQNFSNQTASPRLESSLTWSFLEIS